jgi:hypothetical protein
VEHQTLIDDKGDSIMFVYDAGVFWMWQSSQWLVMS